MAYFSILFQDYCIYDAIAKELPVLRLEETKWHHRLQIDTRSTVKTLAGDRARIRESARLLLFPSFA